jgi:formylglycine-generating enzyme required for sulfatase activity
LGRTAGLIAFALLAATSAAAGEDTSGWATVPGGRFRSALALADAPQGSPVVRFVMMETPVTNRQFLEFVRANPRWLRDRVPTALAEPRYLSHWDGPTQLGNRSLPNSPVVWVSWFAADAYCRSSDARLPTWTEWEYAAAADATRRDARSDPAWRERILAWYAEPSVAALPSVGNDAANAYGLRDLHGLVWEWVEDYSALLVSADNREQGDADELRFCGAGAISTSDRENYAVLMRVAMLSALEGANTTANVGFRCARGP